MTSPKRPPSMRPTLYAEAQALPGEIWKRVQGLDWLEASSLGRVRCWLARGGRTRRLGARPYLLRASVDLGYPRVTVTDKTGRRSKVKVATMVMLAFVGPRPDGMHVCHNNGVRSDNRPENLRYDTPKNNCRDRDVLHGHHLRGSRNHQAVLNEELVARIRRECRPGLFSRFAREIGVSPNAVTRAYWGESWV